MEAPPVPRPTSPKTYVSAPASPRRHIISSFPEYFYSVPTSHTKGLSAFVASCESKLRAPATSSETDSDGDDDFAFSTGQSFRSPPPYFRGPQQWQSSIGGPPAMAFADELFYNGRLLPLKLPPRLQNISPQSSPGWSPRSPSLTPRSGFPGLSFGKKEFDPFTAAMEQIRKKGAASCGKRGHRRARSFDPTGTRLAHDLPQRPLQYCKQEEEEALTETGCKKSKRTNIFRFKSTTKNKFEEDKINKESKTKSGSGWWKKINLYLSRLLQLHSTKGEEWVRISSERGSLSSVERSKDELEQREEDNTQTMEAVTASKSLTCYKRNPYGPKWFVCYGVNPVSPSA